MQMDPNNTLILGSATYAPFLSLSLKKILGKNSDQPGLGSIPHISCDSVGWST